MRTGNYNVQYFFDNNLVEQYVIPEIQRDYVWTTADVLDFLNYLKEGLYTEDIDDPYIGFIYAYNPRDYVYKYFLIDGQQRITTLFLLLVACYHQIGKTTPSFLLNEDCIKLDYKVRPSTHDFLVDLVSHCKGSPGLHFSIYDQIWYYKEYESDQTIRNITLNFNFIYGWLHELGDDLQVFLKYILNDVCLSYFNIEDSRKGEDLYIYMNSRGRQLEPNETLKAKYLSTVLDKEVWGTTWERWQDFFWQHKGLRPDADAGFNDFLKMVQVVSMVKAHRSTDKILGFAAGAGDDKPTYEQLPSTIEELNWFFNGYEWLVTNSVIKELYSAMTGSSEYLTTLPKDRLRFLLSVLPVLTFVSLSNSRDEVSVGRFARFFFNVARKRAVSKDVGSNLVLAIKLMLQYCQKARAFYDVTDFIEYQHGRTVLIDDEEVLKLTLYKGSATPVDRNELEVLFWRAEDHKYFSGEISFFLNECYSRQSNHFDKERFIMLWDTFYRTFGATRDNERDIIIALLYFGDTWIPASPNEYYNFCCNAWFEVVRLKPKPVIALLDTLARGDQELKPLIKKKIKRYFRERSLTTVEALKKEERLFDQVKILAAVDHYTKNWLFSDDLVYIADDWRYTYGDAAFFSQDRRLFNVKRYVRDGSKGRLIRWYQDILSNKDTLKFILQQILEE